MLSNPHGIFINVALDLYVADSGNHRIQMFPDGASNATTVAGNGAPGTISLNQPRAVVLDALDVLFIADTMNHRIVASGSGGFRCILGCGGRAGSSANELNTPVSLSFDRDGNLLVVDQGNARIQKFEMQIIACRKWMPYLKNISVRLENKRVFSRTESMLELLSRFRGVIQPSSLLSVRKVESERHHRCRQWNDRNFSHGCVR